ncbi:MAG: tetratricopeptide repeat protein, partial [Candidatus Competibacteraceae bacterium]|nr:tetratricopeptide repeat protein [Candidatus Competibacteraceae bacterium]
MLELLWLLLPVAAASGWWAARREQTGKQGGCAHSSEYFRGLNYLLDNRPDQAIDVFVGMARVDGDTADAHLTLGNLFRRRGEVDRAIHIHSDLVSRPSLTEAQRGRALLELGEDYMKAGLFDRAEALYRELMEHPGHTATALNRLGD